MAAVMFDTQKYVQTLEEFEFSPKQAAGQTKAMREALEEILAHQSKTQQEAVKQAVEALDSKTEIALVRLEAKIGSLEERVDARFNLVRKDMEGMRKDMEGIRKDIIIWLGGLLIAGFGLVVGLLLKMGS